MTKKVKELLKKELTTYVVHVDDEPVLKSNNINDISKAIKKYFTKTNIKNHGSITISNNNKFFDNF